MVDDRNEAIHTYKEEFARALYEKIKQSYYGLMKKVYDGINERI